MILRRIDRENELARLVCIETIALNLWIYPEITDAEAFSYSSTADYIVNTEQKVTVREVCSLSSDFTVRLIADEISLGQDDCPICGHGRDRL